MAQKSQDLKNLDPMFYWKYVMKKGNRSYPEVRFIDFPINDGALAKLAHNNPEVVFRVESEDPPGGIPVFQSNVHFVWRKMMTPKQRLEALNNTDYVVCKKNSVYGFEAGLCGVRVLHSLDALKNIDILRVLSSLERIENWEKTKELLT